MNGARSNGFVVVAYDIRVSYGKAFSAAVGSHTVIAENSAKIAHDIDHEENCALLRAHGKITAFSIAFNWMTLRGLDEEVINTAGAANDIIGSVSRESKHEDDNKDNHGVGIIGQECGLVESQGSFLSQKSDRTNLDTSKEGIQDNADREEIASRSSRHASQSCYDGGTTGEKHGCHKNVGH